MYIWVYTHTYIWDNLDKVLVWDHVYVYMMYICVCMCEGVSSHIYHISQLSRRKTYAYPFLSTCVYVYI